MSDEKQVSSAFTNMTAAGADADAPQIGIGMLEDTSCRGFF